MIGFFQLILLEASRKLFFLDESFRGKKTYCPNLHTVKDFTVYLFFKHVVPYALFHFIRDNGQMDTGYTFILLVCLCWN